MKIAILMPYPPIIGNQIPVLPGNATQGGGETSTYNFAYKLSKNRNMITYFTGKYEGISVNSLRINDNFKIVYLKSVFKNMGLSAPLKLFIELVRGDYDVIHSHQIPIMYSLIGAIVARLTNKKFLMTFHGRLPFCIIDETIGRIASHLSYAVTVQSKFSYDLLKKFVNKKKLINIPHGVDLEIFYKKRLSKSFITKYKKNNEKIILYTGRLISAKGIDVLIKACSLLKNNMKYKILIVGEGPLKKDLIKLSQLLSISDKVIFIGLIEQCKLPEYYSLADVLVLPSTDHDETGKIIPHVSENFGNVLAEAMACKTPVIASNIGGIPQWIKNNYNGILFKQRDVEDLSSSLFSILTDNQLRISIIKNAYKQIKQNYSWESVIIRFEEIYNAKLLNK